MINNSGSAVRLELAPGELQRLNDHFKEVILKAMKGAVGDATKRLERELEALTRVAVPGNAWKAWTSKVYPRGSKLAYDPVGAVFGNGKRRTQGMLQYWSLPGVNRAKRGQWLAIPTKAAGPQTRGRDLTPGDWERRTGIRLQFVYVPGAKVAYLMASGTLAKNGSGALRNRTARRAGQGRAEANVPIFVLIREQVHANTLPVEPAIRRAQDYMAQTFRRRLNSRLN